MVYSWHGPETTNLTREDTNPDSDTFGEQVPLSYLGYIIEQCQRLIHVA